MNNMHNIKWSVISQHQPTTTMSCNVAASKLNKILLIDLADIRHEDDGNEEMKSSYFASPGFINVIVQRYISAIPIYNSGWF